MPKKHILTVDGGSSSIKFALFKPGSPPMRVLAGGIERIGLPDPTLHEKDANGKYTFSRSVVTPDHSVAIGILMEWVAERGGRDSLAAVGHYLVHGGARYWAPQRITPEMVRELKGLKSFDPEHLHEQTERKGSWP